MKKYEVYSKVDQMITKEILLTCEAESEEEAQFKATVALSDYPQPVVDSSIGRILTCSQTLWTPKSIETKSVKEITE